jgi:hypothetical protein
MTITIPLNTDHINSLDLSPVVTEIEKLLQKGAIEESTAPQSPLASYEQQLRFDINYVLEPGDPRELSEIPEVRLWFIRLDTRYPWLPFLLDWKAGEFARYAAMLVPHQFSTREGIQYNPEALEIFLMHKLFILNDWLQQQGIPSKSRLQSMAQLLGYELDDALFEMF